MDAEGPFLDLLEASLDQAVPVDEAWLKRIQDLVKDVDIGDINAPLDPENE